VTTSKKEREETNVVPASTDPTNSPCLRWTVCSDPMMDLSVFVILVGWEMRGGREREG
jgi:hypothetical protein